ncbi:MAG: hypothetical protein A2176_15555 [Spirochaetes bacterium RBG_13_51_14]|nr:MAG: hypothetical protein A2176_15555 [Spirochaetes bacterium RBG_13_51_14]
MYGKPDARKRLTALITGASSGLGESMAKNLSRRGHDLILVSENLPELNRVKGEIEALRAGPVTVLAMDLFKQDSAERIFEFCRRRNMPVDILINCAGIFLNIDRELNNIKCVESIINLHVMSLAKLCFLFGGVMMGRKQGYILNVSSIAAEFCDPASLTYGPTKRFILALSEALHCEWKNHNITVTCLTPGGIRTNFFRANDVLLPPVIKYSLIEPDACAEIGINAMFRGKLRITPGIFGKLQSLFLRIVSRPSTYDCIKKSYFSMMSRR